MGKSWSDATARYLANASICPRCGGGDLPSGWCASCGADLSGPEAIQVWEASARAAEALVARQSLIDSLPTIARAAAPATPAASAIPTAVVSAPGPLPSLTPPTNTRSSQISVQSVLAVAGASLFAVAAIVFTFFNPDLTDFATRTTIVALITALFIGAAWLMARIGLQFSAEAVGALGVVFVALDVSAFVNETPPGISGFVYAAIGTLLSSVLLMALSTLARIRTWLWAAMVGIAITPALLGYAVNNFWAPIIGHLVVGFVALGMLWLAHRLETRFGGSLRAERTTTLVIRILVAVIVPLQLLVGLVSDPGTSRVLGSAAALAGLTLLAALSARSQAAKQWSFVLGGFWAGAFALLPLALQLEVEQSIWLFALIPLAAVLGMLNLTAIKSTHRLLILGGAGTVVLLATLPASVAALVQLTVPIAQLVGRASNPFGEVSSATDPELGLAAILGLAATAAGCWAASLLIGRTTAAGVRATTLALWVGGTSLLTVASWTSWLHPTQVVIGLVIAVALSAVLLRLPAVRAWPLRFRVPLSVVAHAALVLAAVIGWNDPSIRILAGAAAVAVLAVVAQTAPNGARPLYVAVGYAYALVIFATALDMAGLDAIAVQCLTTALGSAIALGATLVRRLDVRYWYAILLVTAVPFLIGIVSVLLVRSGWTALSTGVTFALALTLVITTRPGLNRILRGIAAALLVPALAVVVISLGAQVILVSASPITLPIIAAIVALTLPATGHIGAALVRRGISEPDARIARLWIEISSLVTAALAVLLALVRAAAGLGTTLLVLLIIGLGALATGFLTRRRYSWAVAGASFTGALWCFWALQGVEVLEPYVLPPALGAALVGAIMVARGLSGIRLYAIGLAVAAVPSLVLLAIGAVGDAPWRGLGLLAGSLLLVTFAALLPRLVTLNPLRRLGALRVPTLAVTILAAAGGVIQAVRYGWSLDPLGTWDGELAMAPVLALSLMATILAAVAADLLTQGGNRGRWLYAPALVYLVAGPIAAVRPGWFPILAVFALAIVLLAVMLLTVVRARRGPVTLPPVWFTFVLAWCTAVASWSERELRVEAFSLPLGLALLAAGIIAMRPGTQPPEKVGMTSWPIGFSGSWRLLGPGILVTLVPSMLATGTDPRTERAILVIGLALVAILIGSLRKLAAPFIIGIIALPIENVIVFVVQIGQSIGALPWWITLATAGAVLLVIAVTYERRVSGERGVVARLRDLT